MPIKNFAGTVRGSGGPVGIGVKVDRGGGGAPFTPSSLGGLVAWFDASAITGISNGGLIGRWTDSAVNRLGWDSPLPQSLPAGYYSHQGNPVYNSSDALLNNKPSVTYNGASSNVVRTDNDDGNMPYGSQASTTYVAGYWNGSPGGSMFGWGNNVAGGRMGVGKSPSGMIFESVGMGSKPRAVSANSPFILSFAYVASSNYTAATTHLNGVADTGEFPGFPGVPNIVYSGPPSYNTAEISIGNIPAGGPFVTDFWNGTVAEVIVYNTTHTATERAQVTSYLSSKYGISVV